MEMILSLMRPFWAFISFFCLFVCLSSIPAHSYPVQSFKPISGQENLSAWMNGILSAGGAAAQAQAPGPSNQEGTLVLAENRTARPDILSGFRKYRGGWDIADKHYWASVGFTGAVGFILGVLWFLFFGLALVIYGCCGWRIDINGRKSNWSLKLCLILLIIFTCAAVIGGILLSVGQVKFHNEASQTLKFVVNQSDYTVQTLRNVTAYMSLAESVSVAQVFLPSDVKDDIDRLNVDLNNAADTLESKTNESSGKIKRVFNIVRSAMIGVAVVMLLVSLLGLVVSILGHPHAIYVFVISGWLLVAVTFILCGVFVILNRSILRDITDGKELEYVQKPDYAVELNAENFDEVLRDTPATYAVVEFFAHWCPACRNYKPHYERVARLFNGADAVHPGIVLMTRVDCASKINTDLCNKFSVEHYPMLFWGPPSKFVSGSWDPKKENSGLREIDDGRTADRLLNWINKQLGSSYTLTDEKFKNEHIQNITSDPAQISRAIYDVEEATATAFDIIIRHKMIKSETRAPLLKFLQLLVAHHPSRRCRKGTAEILIDFDDLFPPKMVIDSKKDLLQSTHICGKEVPRGYWMFCRGSSNDTRGFSCGLWVLLHSLSVRIDDGESQLAFQSVCDFIHNFFVCEDCRVHFYEMCSSVTTPFGNSRDFVHWLWDAHNKVNERLKEVEASSESGDPFYPKTIWPSKQLCPTCYVGADESQKPGEFDKNEVFKFLVSYYGQGLVAAIYKDKELLVGENQKSTTDELPNAIAVPAGAAFGILAASCAFGGLAWFWRWRQKNRKQRRSRQ